MARLGAVTATAALLVLLTGCGSLAVPSEYTASVTVAPTGGPTPTAPSPSAPPASAPPSTTTAPAGTTALADQCPDGALGVTLVPMADEAGSPTLDVLITNVGGETCSLRGAPRVAVVEGASRPRIGAAAEQVQDGARTVSLAAGATAAATLRIEGLDGCTTQAAAGYRVIAPGGERAVFVADPAAVGCADGTAFMTVGPLTAQ